MHNDDQQAPLWQRDGMRPGFASRFPRRSRTGIVQRTALLCLLAASLGAAPSVPTSAETRAIGDALQTSRGASHAGEDAGHARATGAQLGPRWLPPLGEPLRVSTPFGLPHGPYRSGHRGIDLPAEPDGVVRSPAAGTVSFSGTVVDRPVLSVRVDDRTVVSFEPLEGDLSTGDPVARGQPLGRVGAGGHCDGACLHLGVRVDGEYANPLRFLLARPVLLPW